MSAAAAAGSFDISVSVGARDMDLNPTTSPLAAVIVALVGSGGVGAVVVQWMKGRKSPPAAIAASQADLASALSAQTKDILAEHRKDRRQLRGALNRQDKELRDLRAEQRRQAAELATCQERHEGCEHSLAEVRAEIARLMAETPPAADYSELKRPT